MSPRTLILVAICLSGLYAAAVALVSIFLIRNGEKPLTLNEFGDTLAGIFAPLAFLWFVTTVFLQLIELRIQREEQSEARKSFKEQAEHARRSAESLNQQIEIISRNHEVSIEVSQYGAFKERYDLLLTRIINELCSIIDMLKRMRWKFSRDIPDTTESLLSSQNHSQKLAVIEQICAFLESEISQKRSPLGDDVYTFYLMSRKLQTLPHSIDDLLRDTPDFQHVREAQTFLKDMRLSSIKEKLQSIASTCDVKAKVG